MHAWIAFILLLSHANSVKCQFKDAVSSLNILSFLLDGRLYPLYTLQTHTDSSLSTRLNKRGRWKGKFNHLLKRLWNRIWYKLTFSQLILKWTLLPVSLLIIRFHAAQLSLKVSSYFIQKYRTISNLSSLIENP